MQILVLMLLTFKKVKLIFGHPVYPPGERLNCSILVGLWNGLFIFHRVNIFQPSHKFKTVNICFISLLHKAKKKKYFVSKLARIFQTDAACGFLFFILFFFYFNWPLPPRTSKTKNDWKVSTSVFSEIKRDFTRFLSSHVLKFFQNSKLSSFFVVKMKKKK